MNRKELLQGLDRTKTYTAEEVAEFLESELIRCTGAMTKKALELYSLARDNRTSEFTHLRSIAFVHEHSADKIRFLSNGLSGITGLDDINDDTLKLQHIIRLYPFLKTGE